MVVQIIELPEKGMIINGLMSELTMFVIESYDTLIKINPDFKRSFETQNIEHLRNMRHRAKLLEYVKDINDGLLDLDSININQIDRFQSHHKGQLYKLKKLIQPDLGLTKYKGHFITTTHSTIFDLGSEVILEKESLFSFGETVGDYLQTIIGIFKVDETCIEKKYICRKEDYQMLDIKSKNLFNRSKFENDNKKFASALILILVRLNYTKTITSEFLPQHSDTLIRVKFLNTYHALKSLNKIQSIVMKGTPSDNERMFFKETLGKVEAKWLIKQSSLRNLYVHYLLDKKQLKRLPSKFTREEAIQVLSEGLSSQDIDKKLDVLLENITSMIEGFFKLTERTFWINRIET